MEPQRKPGRDTSRAPGSEVKDVREVLSVKTPRSVELHQHSSRVLAAEVVQTVHMPALHHRLSLRDRSGGKAMTSRAVS